MTRGLLRTRLTDALLEYEQARGTLPGIVQRARRAALVEQLVESARRVQYLEHLAEHPGGPRAADPASTAFNPLRAAVIREQEGERDEAFWLVFLFVHFGNNKRSGWSLIADIYGRLGEAPLWSWSAVTADVNAFRSWLENNVEQIRSFEPRRGFGNHRKYESLGAWNANGTGAVVASYATWVGAKGHGARVAQLVRGATTPAQRFDALYRSVRSVRRFGRTGAFDYCSTLANLSFVAMEPNAACLVGATGPLAGARLLLGEPGESAAALEKSLTPLQAQLGVGFDVLEDALCNWQKSPDAFKPFRG